jgi:hypothetical protein
MSPKKVAVIPYADVVVGGAIFFEELHEVCVCEIYLF